MSWLKQYTKALRERSAVALELAQQEENLKTLEAKIAQAADYRSLGKNDTERKQAFMLVLDASPEYKQAKMTAWRLRERLSELDVRIEELKAMRRAEEWRTRARLADAMAALAGLEAHDAHIERGAMDVAMDAAAAKAMSETEETWW